MSSPRQGVTPPGRTGMLVVTSVVGSACVGHVVAAWQARKVAAAAEREMQERAAAAQREMQERAAAAQREMQQRAAAAQREVQERAAAAQREFEAQLKELQRERELYGDYLRLLERRDYAGLRSLLESKSNPLESNPQLKSRLKNYVEFLLFMESNPQLISRRKQACAAPPPQTGPKLRSQYTRCEGGSTRQVAGPAAQPGSNDEPRP